MGVVTASLTGSEISAGSEKKGDKLIINNTNMNNDIIIDKL